MADTKISDLGAASALAGTEVLPVVQSSNTMKATINQVKTAVSASPTFTGVATLAAGTAGAPALTWTGDTNTGLYSDTADTIQVSTGGTLRAIFGSTTNLLLQAGSATDVPLAAKGAAAQSASLQQWQDSTGTVLASVSNGGSIQAPYFQDPTFTGPYVEMGTTALSVINRTTTTNVPLVVQGMAAQSGNLQQWQDSAGTVVARVGASGIFTGLAANVSYVNATSVYDPTATGPFLYMAGYGIEVYNQTNTSFVPFNVVGMASQAAALQAWKTSTGTVLASVSAAGLGAFAGVTLTDATDLVVGSTTGTKIGTATTQKLGFYNATPVVQQTNVTNPTGGATVDAEARTAIDAILSRLETLGLFAA